MSTLLSWSVSESIANSAQRSRVRLATLPRSSSIRYRLLASGRGFGLRLLVIVAAMLRSGFGSDNEVIYTEYRNEVM